MTDYQCPKEIEKLFSTPKLAESHGREAFIEWVKSLNMCVGDRVWIPNPEGGTFTGSWHIKEGRKIQ